MPTAKVKRTAAPPTRESFHLSIARSRYLHDRIDIDEFERLVEHVLRGGTLTLGGSLDEPMFEPPLRGT